ncbi:MAG TPA: hypothetical protein DIS66_04710 [Candidatus Omnitrophica bacterium]|mgnify:CR=1 FL=1|nr:hypothetical protein [Candidatus Omnitrophota bacterium]
MSSKPVKPVMPDYERHIFVCVGEKCHPSRGHAVYDHLKQTLKKDPDPRLRCVKRSQSKCLTVCQGGPIAVVYPEGVWYGEMNEKKIDHVIEEHLKGGKPVDEWVFYPKRFEGEWKDASK